ncbi:MAG: hypothetical protein GC145_04120 [Caulobacter sp.]|nr:hypothetical protein [Caulobacter sp.]
MRRQLTRSGAGCTPRDFQGCGGRLHGRNHAIGLPRDPAGLAGRGDRKRGFSMRVFLGALFALAVMSSPALAQNLKADVSLAKDSRMVKSVSVEDLKAIVVDQGYEVTEVGGLGDVSVEAKTDEGLIFLLIGTACEVEGYKPNCLGINMQVRYDSDEDVTVEKINQATLSYAAVSTWLDKDSNTLGITRYAILDDGVTMANIKANLTTLLAIAPRISDIIWP